MYEAYGGDKEVEPNKFYKKYICNTAKNINPASFDLMSSSIDDALSNLRPSKKSDLLWTRCAALVGYKAKAPEESKNHMWDEAIAACRFDPDGPNKFVGSLIYWRISLRKDNIWLTSKTKDAGRMHEHRTYWINNEWILMPKNTTQDLANKFKR